MKFILLILINFLFFEKILANNLAFIDFNYILNNSTAGIQLVNKLQKTNVSNIKILKNEQLDINNEKLEIEKKKNILSNEQLNIKISKYNTRLEKFNLKQDEMSNNFKKLRENEITDFIKNINPLIENYMVKNNIDLIIKKESIYISKTDLDISNEIIKLIDSKINN